MLKYISKTKGFTLVELIVVITILAILSTVAFISFQNYVLSSRDSKRTIDIKNIVKSLELSKLQTGVYPQPGGVTNITFSGATAWKQGEFNNDVTRVVRNFKEAPKDPLVDSFYAYSVTNNQGEYQLGAVLEDTDYGTSAKGKLAAAYVKGNYNGKTVKVSTGGTTYILGAPSILTSDLNETDLLDILTAKKLVYKGYQNLPASYTGTVYDLDGGFDFSPASIVAYQGDLASVDNATLVDNLQNIYTGSVIAEEPDIEVIFSEDKDLTADVVLGKKPGTSSSSSSSTNNNDAGPKIIKVIDFEDPTKYTIDSSLAKELWELSSFTNAGSIATSISQSGNNSFNPGNGGCFAFNVVADKNFIINFSALTSGFTEGFQADLIYKYNGSFQKETGIVESFSNSSQLSYNGSPSSDIWNKLTFTGPLTEGNDFPFPPPPGMAIFNKGYFVAGNYEFNFCSEPWGGDLHIDDVVIQEYIEPSCQTQPSYANADYFIGTPEAKNVAWQNTDSNAACYYRCKLGFEGSDCSQTIAVDNYDRLFYFIKNNDLEIYPSNFLDSPMFALKMNLNSLYFDYYSRGTSDVDTYTIDMNAIGTKIFDSHRPKRAFGSNHYYYKGSSYSINTETSAQNIIEGYSYVSNPVVMTDYIAFTARGTDSRDILLIDELGNKTVLSNGDFNGISILGLVGDDLYYQKTVYPTYYLKKINIVTKAITEISSQGDNYFNQFAENNRIYFDNKLYFNEYGTDNIKSIDSSGNIATIPSVIDDMIPINSESFIGLDYGTNAIYKVDKGFNVTLLKSGFRAQASDSFTFNNKIYFKEHGTLNTLIFDLPSFDETMTTESLFTLDGQRLYKVIDGQTLEEIDLLGNIKIRNGLNIYTGGPDM